MPARASTISTSAKCCRRGLGRTAGNRIAWFCLLALWVLGEGRPAAPDGPASPVRGARCRPAAAWRPRTARRARLPGFPAWRTGWPPARARRSGRRAPARAAAPCRSPGPENEAHGAGRAGGTQAVTVLALEGRAGQHHALPRHGLGQQPCQPVQPAAAVVVGQGMPACILRMLSRHGGHRPRAGSSPGHQPGPAPRSTCRSRKRP